MVDAATGGVLEEITVDATPEGYAELVGFANQHAALRAWAIEGTGGHGAGLSRHLQVMSEIVIELDRPKRRARDVEGSARTSEGHRDHHPQLTSDLLEEFGVGPIVAATVLCAWSHPGRVHSEAAFATLAGVAPIPANSGQVTTRYRLNRYGDRRLNTALHTVVQIRIQYQQPTRDYIAPHRQGKTSREIKRCLARYVASDLYRLLESGPRAA